MRSIAVSKLAFLCIAPLLAAACNRAGESPAASSTPESPSPSSIDLATTTSVRDSGLLAALLPDFERRTGIAVRVIAVGTGAALRMGAEGNADVLLTHAPPAEQALVDSGAVLSRVPFMENFFVIAGPPDDPAGIVDATSATEAFRLLEDARAPYVSRADDSGTHKREMALMRAAGFEPEHGWEGVTRTGTGMGLTLMVAGERQSYVLSDISTFLAFRERTGLRVLSRGGSDLRNVYSVLRVDPARFAQRQVPIDGAGALAFESFLLEAETQRRIADFGRERYGRELFKPLHLPDRKGAGLSNQ